MYRLTDICIGCDYCCYCIRLGFWFELIQFLFLHFHFFLSINQASQANAKVFSVLVSGLAGI